MININRRRQVNIAGFYTLDAIKYRMEQQGLSNKDLADILGFKSRVTDIFNKHRKLSLSMIRKLHNELHIPLEILVREY